MCANLKRWKDAVTINKLMKMFVPVCWGPVEISSLHAGSSECNMRTRALRARVCRGHTREAKSRTSRHTELSWCSLKLIYTCSIRTISIIRLLPLHTHTQNILNVFTTKWHASVKMTFCLILVSGNSKDFSKVWLYLNWEATILSLTFNKTHLNITVCECSTKLLHCLNIKN